MKRQLTFSELHGIISQKIELSLVMPGRILEQLREIPDLLMFEMFYVRKMKHTYEITLFSVCVCVHVRFQWRKQSMNTHIKAPEPISKE
jgi:hypothetical protein